MTTINTVFVTGATGYIGRNVARAFRRTGWRVFGLTRDEGKRASLAAEEITPVIGKLQSPAAWRGVAASADVIVHAAVDYAADTQALDQEVTRTLVDIAREHAGTLIYTSGVWVQAPGAEVADESSGLAPADIVSLRPVTEKVALEAPRGVVIRPGIVYGRQGGLTAAFFLDQPLVGDGTNHWPLVHVDDLAQAYVRAAGRADARGVYIIADESRVTARELAIAARQAAGFAGPPRWLPVAEARKTMGGLADALARDHRISSARAQRELGWRPLHAGFIAEAATYAGASRAAK